MTAQELKNSILQLAIQGKLVKQNPNDEPVSVLLEKVKQERQKLIQEKKIKKEKYSEIYRNNSDNRYYEKFEDGTIKDITTEIPFDIPKSWKWCRLIDICVIIFSGKSPKYSKIPNANLVLGQKNNQDYGIDLNGIKYCVNEFMEQYPQELYLQNNDVLLNTLGGGTVGRSGIFDLKDHNKYISDGHLFVIRTLFEETAKYILYYLRLNRNKIEKNADGSTNQIFLKLDNVKKYLIPIPPLKEQSRIFKKITLLEDLILKYDDLYLKLETLNNSYKEQLRKSILQYAVQGKLVKQDIEDGSAKVLINRIINKKRELIKSKQIKKENLSVIYKDKTDNQFYEKFDNGKVINITKEIPFDIPNNWEWVRLKNLSVTISKGTTPKGGKNAYLNKGINFLRAENVKASGKVSLENVMYIDENIHKNFLKRSILEDKDILICIAGTLGRCAIITKQELPANTNQAVCFIRLIDKNDTLVKFILNSLSSFEIQKSLLKQTKVTAIPNLTLEIIGNCLIPIPPSNEQKSIVDKLEEIFDSIC